MGIAIVLVALANPLAEISVEVQKWTKAFGMMAIGASLGLFIRNWMG